MAAQSPRGEAEPKYEAGDDNEPDSDLGHVQTGPRGLIGTQQDQVATERKPRSAVHVALPSVRLQGRSIVLAPLAYSI
jgi:hypothetical protein